MWRSSPLHAFQALKELVATALFTLAAAAAGDTRPTVFDFKRGEVRKGGQTGPVTLIWESLVFRHADKPPGNWWHFKYRNFSGDRDGAALHPWQTIKVEIRNVRDHFFRKNLMVASAQHNFETLVDSWLFEQQQLAQLLASLSSCKIKISEDPPPLLLLEDIKPPLLLEDIKPPLLLEDIKPLPSNNGKGAVETRSAPGTDPSSQGVTASAFHAVVVATQFVGSVISFPFRPTATATNDEASNTDGASPAGASSAHDADVPPPTDDDDKASLESAPVGSATSPTVDDKLTLAENCANAKCHKHLVSTISDEISLEAEHKVASDNDAAPPTALPGASPGASSVRGSKGTLVDKARSDKLGKDLVPMVSEKIQIDVENNKVTPAEDAAPPAVSPVASPVAPPTDVSKVALFEKASSTKSSEDLAPTDSDDTPALGKRVDRLLQESARLLDFASPLGEDGRKVVAPVAAPIVSPADGNKVTLVDKVCSAKASKVIKTSKGLAPKGSDKISLDVETKTAFANDAAPPVATPTDSSKVTLVDTTSSAKISKHLKASKDLKVSKNLAPTDSDNFSLEAEKKAAPAEDAAPIDASLVASRDVSPAGSGKVALFEKASSTKSSEDLASTDSDDTLALCKRVERAMQERARLLDFASPLGGGGRKVVAPVATPVATPADGNKVTLVEKVCSAKASKVIKTSKDLAPKGSDKISLDVETKAASANDAAPPVATPTDSSKVTLVDTTSSGKISLNAEIKAAFAEDAAPPVATPVATPADGNKVTLVEKVCSAKASKVIKTSKDLAPKGSDKISLDVETKAAIANDAAPPVATPTDSSKVTLVDTTSSAKISKDLKVSKNLAPTVSDNFSLEAENKAAFANDAASPVAALAASTVDSGKPSLGEVARIAKLGEDLKASTDLKVGKDVVPKASDDTLALGQHVDRVLQERARLLDLVSPVEDERKVVAPVATPIARSKVTLVDRARNRKSHKDVGKAYTGESRKDVDNQDICELSLALEKLTLPRGTSRDADHNRAPPAPNDTNGSPHELEQQSMAVDKARSQKDEDNSDISELIVALEELTLPQETGRDMDPNRAPPAPNDTNGSPHEQEQQRVAVNKACSRKSRKDEDNRDVSELIVALEKLTLPQETGHDMDPSRAPPAPNGTNGSPHEQEQQRMAVDKVGESFVADDRGAASGGVLAKDGPSGLVDDMTLGKPKRQPTASHANSELQNSLVAARGNHEESPGQQACSAGDIQHADKSDGLESIYVAPVQRTFSEKDPFLSNPDMEVDQDSMEIGDDEVFSRSFVDAMADGEEVAGEREMEMEHQSEEFVQCFLTEAQCAGTKEAYGSTDARHNTGTYHPPLLVDTGAQPRLGLGQRPRLDADDRFYASYASNTDAHDASLLVNFAESAGKAANASTRPECAPAQDKTPDDELMEDAEGNPASHASLLLDFANSKGKAAQALTRLECASAMEMEDEDESQEDELEEEEEESEEESQEEGESEEEEVEESVEESEEESEEEEVGESEEEEVEESEEEEEEVEVEESEEEEEEEEVEESEEEEEEKEFFDAEQSDDVDDAENNTEDYYASLLVDFSQSKVGEAVDSTQPDCATTDEDMYTYTHDIDTGERPSPFSVMPSKPLFNVGNDTSARQLHARQRPESVRRRGRRPQQRRRGHTSTAV